MKTMMKITLTAAALLFAGTFTAAAQVTDRVTDRVTDLAPLPVPTLKGAVTISGSLVRIGDLIDNAGEAADVAIFRAPDLGTTGAVPARRVLDAVLSHRLFGVETHGLTEILVTRDSRAISTHDIETSIAASLSGRNGLGAATNLAITFDRDLRVLQAEPQATAQLRVVRQTYDPRGGRFDVTLELPGSAAFPRGTLRYTGTVVETVEAIVPARNLTRGEVIRAADVEVTRLRKSDVAADALTRVDDAVGLAAKAAMRSGVAVRRADLAKPELVARNDNVTIVFEVPGITLTSRGKALESGAEGDIISVQNVQSKRAVQATIVGPGTVTVIGNRGRLAESLAASRAASGAASRVSDIASNSASTQIATARAE